MLKLVLLLPENKLPFIGVLCPNEEDARHLNQDLIHDHQFKSYRIIFEAMPKHLNIRLICEEMVDVRFYNHIHYNPAQLKSWLYVLTVNKPSKVVFSQLIERDGKMFPVETKQQGMKFKLYVQKCEVFQPFKKESPVTYESKPTDWKKH